jgi:hypothetical protein
MENTPEQTENIEQKEQRPTINENLKQDLLKAVKNTNNYKMKKEFSYNKKFSSPKSKHSLT